MDNSAKAACPKIGIWRGMVRMFWSMRGREILGTRRSKARTVCGWFARFGPDNAKTMALSRGVMPFKRFTTSFTNSLQLANTHTNAYVTSRMRVTYTLNSRTRSYRKSYRNASIAIFLWLEARPACREQNRKFLVCVLSLIRYAGYFKKINALLFYRRFLDRKNKIKTKKEYRE